MKRVFIIIAVMALLVSCGQQPAETAENAEAQNLEQKDTLKQPQDPKLQALAVGRKLARFGYENESPSALIEAANILVNIPMIKWDVQKKSQSGAASTAEPAYAYDPVSLIEAARKLANDDNTLLAMIAKVEAKISSEASAERGEEECIHFLEESIEGNDVDEYIVEFPANTIAACQVIGNGKTDLDLYVYDSEGNLVAEDADYVDQCYCSWIPNETSMFTIKVINRGTTPNFYTIGVN